MKPEMSTNENVEVFSQDSVDQTFPKGSAIIELIHVKKVYVSDGVPTEALRGVSLRVTRGEFIAVVGPSGSGKSTLLHLVGGLDRPTSGKVLIGGNDINKLSDEKLAELRNEKIGFVFQFYNLIPYLPVIKNVELPLIVKGISSQERKERVLKLLEEVGLKDKAFTRPTRISGGEQQRVAIARALINNPEILLADEPTGNLDSKNSIMIAELFRELNDKGKTIVMVTHNLEVASYAKRILYIRDGLIEREELKT